MNLLVTEPLDVKSGLLDIVMTTILSVVVLLLRVSVCPLVPIVADTFVYRALALIELLRYQTIGISCLLKSTGCENESSDDLVRVHS